MCLFALCCSQVVSADPASVAMALPGGQRASSESAIVNWTARDTAEGGVGRRGRVQATTDTSIHQHRDLCKNPYASCTMFTHSLTFPVLSGGGLHYEGDKHLLEQLKAVGARASTGVIFHSKRTDHSWGWGWGGGVDHTYCSDVSIH